MTSAFNNYNGEIVPANQLLQLNNRVLRYGDGVFESMRMVKGKLQFADLHAKRLQAGMKALKLDHHSELDLDFLQDKAKELSLRNRSKNGLLHLTVFRVTGGQLVPDTNKLAYLIEWQTLANQDYTLNSRGLLIAIFEDVPKPINSLSNLKTCSALQHVLAGVFKQSQKLDDAFILNQNGFLCEAISSNIFIKYNQTIYTPALSEGCIEGVMRQTVIELAYKNSIPIIEAQINPHVLNEADEVFLTSAEHGIQWVLGFGKKRYFNECGRFLSSKLNEKLKEI